MDFSFIKLLHLIPLFIVGIVCSYTDIRFNKIFNKWIYASLAYIFVLYIFLYFYNSLFLHQSENYQYIFKAISNGFVAIVGSYFLWYWGRWSAGDAKLFSVFVLLIPLDFYSESYFSYFPAFNLLANLFFPLLLALIVMAVIDVVSSLWKQKGRGGLIEQINFKPKSTFRQLKSLGQMYVTYLFVFSFFRLVSQPLRSLPGGKIFSNQFVLLAGIIFLRTQITKMKSRFRWVEVPIYGLVVFYSSFLLLRGQVLSFFAMLRMAVAIMVLVGVSRKVLSFYVRRRAVRTKHPNELERGDILSADGMRQIYESLGQKDLQEKFGGIEPGGLSRKQIKLLRKEFSGDKEIKIETYKTFAFAPFMLLAAIITVVTKSSFLVIFVKIFEFLA